MDIYVFVYAYVRMCSVCRAINEIQFIAKVENKSENFDRKNIF
jgi:hypothetical protein